MSYGKEIVDLAKVYFEAPDLTSLDEEASLIKVFRQEIDNANNILKEDVKGIIKNTQVNANVKGKMLYMPLRIALTGAMHGPDFSSLIYLLGKEEIINRLNRVIK